MTPETARLLQHWRHHPFSSIRPFFCQVEAVEVAIWLIEVAPALTAGKKFLDHLENANNDANPGLARLALKLATGAGKTTVMAMLIAWQTINAVRQARQQEVHARIPGCYPWPYHPRPLAGSPTQRSRRVLPDPRTRPGGYARRR